MDLASEYLNQDRWRDWERLLDRLPCRPDDDLVLDLGCGPGTVSRRLAGRVRAVVGIDRDPALLEAARRHCPDNCRFLQGDLTRPDQLPIDPADGLWASFVAAYFPKLEDALPAWTALLRPGSWLALVEVDRMLLGHRPLPPDVRAMLRSFAGRARRRRLYDVDMGSKLARFVSKAGLTLVAESRWSDPELAFQGPAPPEVVDAWRRRFDRMPTLRADLGDARFARCRDAFLECLSAPDHACDAAVVMVIARKP
jgi:SAM-dependent methyltransferase